MTTFTSWENWVATMPEQVADASYPDPRVHQWAILASPSGQLLGLKGTELEALDYAETVNQSRQLVGETAIAIFKGYPGMGLG